MKNLQLKVDFDLWADLRQTAKDIDEKYRKFYAQCLEKGLAQVKKDIAKSEYHDLLVEIARQIILKFDDSIDTPQQKRVEFHYKGDIVQIEGNLQYFFRTIDDGSTPPYTNVIGVDWTFNKDYPCFYESGLFIPMGDCDVADMILKLMQ